MKLRHGPSNWRVPLALAGLLCAATVQAATVLLALKHEPQKQTNWCWASVSAMADHSFAIKAGSRAVSQLNIVNFEKFGVRTDADRSAKSSLINSQGCHLTDTLCNYRRETWLYRIDGSQVQPGHALTEAALINEIATRRRPVIIKWDFSSAGASNAGQPSGEHYLIITGYKPTSGLFRVYDPWSGVDSTSGGNTSWIRYQDYLSPDVLLGEPVSAIHESDVFNLNLGSGQSLPPAPTAMQAVSPLQPINLTSVSFDDLLQATSVVTEAALSKAVYTAKGAQITAPLRVGQLYPIVVLTTRQLLDARERPEALLEPRSSSIIATVVKASNGKIVDSRLIYNKAGVWIPAAFSNTHLTRLLERVRAAHPMPADDRRNPYYLVSIPEQGVFLAARGFGAEARLWSLDRDARGGALEAHEALRDVIRLIESQPRDRQSSTDSPARAPESSHDNR
jgi:hypothetical protein